jgi:hypothetical protein
MPNNLIWCPAVMRYSSGSRTNLVATGRIEYALQNRRLPDRRLVLRRLLHGRGSGPRGWLVGRIRKLATTWWSHRARTARTRFPVPATNGSRLLGAHFIGRRTFRVWSHIQNNNKRHAPRSRVLVAWENGTVRHPSLSFFFKSPSFGCIVA